MDKELLEIKDAILATTKDAVAGLKGQLDEMQRQLDSIDLKAQKPDYAVTGTGGLKDGVSAIGAGLIEHKDSLQKYGRVRFEVPTLLPECKSAILSTGLTSAEPTSVIAAGGRFPYRVRSLFRSIKTDLPTVGVLRETGFTNAASPQVEGGPKSESTITFELKQVPIQTIAHWTTVSRQALDDITGLQEFLRSTLLHGLEQRAESEILFGDATGQHLTGLVPQATEFDTAILGNSSWNYADVLGGAACQLRESGYMPDFAVLSPLDWFRLMTTKDTSGQYIFTSASAPARESVFQLQIIASPLVAGGVFLVGDSSQAVVRQKQEATVQVAFQHAEDFTRNLVTILCEERFALQVLQPSAFVTGNLTSSPA